MIKSIDFDDLPQETKNAFLKQQIDIVINIIEKAGLLLEFLSFVESEEAFKVKSFDELCIEFAKKYPEKLYTVPSKDRDSFVLIWSNHE